MAVVTYEDHAGRPSPVHQDVRCFASCVGRTCYRSCHPDTRLDGPQRLGPHAVNVVGGLIVEACSPAFEYWCAEDV